MAACSTRGAGEEGGARRALKIVMLRTEEQHMAGSDLEKESKDPFESLDGSGSP